MSLRNSRLPSLPALRAFEAAARLNSFTKAAEEIGATQSGVSHQIKLLETQLGVPLFVRGNRRIELTEDGRQLAEPLSTAFGMIATACAAIGRRSDARLAITAARSLNPAWLIAALEGFQKRHPDIEVTLHTSPDLVDLHRGEFDVGLRSGEGVWDGLVAEKLIPFRLSPHCTPDFAEKHGPFRTPADLLSCPLVEREDWAWARWFEAAGCGEVDLRGLPSVRLHSRNLFGEAALASRGAALLNPELYAAEVAGGRLVQPFETVLDLSPRAFWLVYPETSRRSRAVRLFSAFLSEHVATSSSDSG